MKNKILFGILVWIFFAFPCLGAKNLDIVINEICWMGTNVSQNKEWIELYNNTKTLTSLDGWKLISEDKGIEIELKGVISAEGFFLLERTDDNSVPKILANQIYKGYLSNEGERLSLIDESEKIIDGIDCSESWFGGNNLTKSTLERIDSKLAGSDKDNWQESNVSGGTPGQKNSEGQKLILKESISDIKMPSSFPSGVLINEILPSPEGPDSENEYIEIFNENAFEVDLSDWTLSDLEGTTKTFKFQKETKIEAKNFIVFFRPQTKIVLNNSGDGLKFLKPDGKIADQVYYKNSPKGESFNRINNDWMWSKNLTPGSENVFSEIKNQALKEIENKTEDKEKIPVSVNKNDLLGTLFPGTSDKSLNKEIPKSFIFVSLAALGIAFFSAILVLVFKRNFLSKNLKS